MKDFIRRPEFVRSLEFWTATSIFIVAVFFRITGALTGDVSGMPILDVSQMGRIPPHYYRLFFFPQLLQYCVLYGAFLLMNFVIVPRIIAGRSVVLNILLGIVVIGALGVGLGTLDTYLKHHLLHSYGSIEDAYFNLFRERIIYSVWLAIVYGVYAFAMYGGMYVLRHLEALQERYRFLTWGGVLAMIMWVMSLFFLLALTNDKELIAVWGVFPPATILFYWCATYYLIPKALGRKKPFRAYLLRSFLVLLSAFLPVGLVSTIISARPDVGFPTGVLNSIFQFLVTAPASWVFYMRGLKGAEELSALREKLGQSKASLDFLRSQINPHFLFNALNTIYGTAIEEKAERTGEGVQRLGDMMRFMLQENNQEEIPLAREVEYLNNYISLQRLRTDSHPGISIKTDIDQEVTTARIAPMLLIPFVENAFKHGISLREPSYIRIGMELKGNSLNFDVHNSKHVRTEADPEKNSSGIGLNNVRQRLELLYPERHELMIRETGKEFFVHLTIELSASKFVVS